MSIFVVEPNVLDGFLVRMNAPSAKAVHRDMSARTFGHYLCICSTSNCNDVQLFPALKVHVGKCASSILDIRRIYMLVEPDESKTQSLTARCIWGFMFVYF